MSYYEEKRKELTELLKLVRKEKADFENAAKLERENIDRDITLLHELGIFGKEDSELKKLMEVKAKLNQEISEFERYKKEAEEQQNIKLNKAKAELESYRQEIELQLEEKRKELINLAKSYVSDEAREAIFQLAQEKSQGFPWLAKAYEDYFLLQDLQLGNYLESKPHPAIKAAEDHRQIATERREAEKAARLANYLLDYCRYLAPWLDEYIGLEAKELDEIIKQIHSSWEKKEREFDEEVKRHFGPKYEGLTPTEKLQKKLDWYWQKPNKSNWQIGRDYERYIGYLYWGKGWDVEYHGRKGYEDLGRDLICKKDTTIEIVQCKYWARGKIIHEKHIYYLFGTSVEYFLEDFGDKQDFQLAVFPSLIQKKNVIPKLITTIEVSPKAHQVAKLLRVGIEKIPFPSGRYPYPSVKCNVSRRDGTKIYHLPFDQQYDTTKIEEERTECYVETVAKAEALGFRHAKWWRGEISE